jgi:hypothetical protein
MDDIVALMTGAQSLTRIFCYVSKLKFDKRLIVAHLVVQTS